MTEVNNQENTDNNTEYSPIDAEKEALKQQISELEDKMLRIAAELENVKKRTEKEKEDTAKFCISAFAKDILTIRDNLKLAISNSAEEKSSVLDGVQMTLTEMDRILGRHNIVVIDSLGKPFDPHLHQAMFETEMQESEPGIVIQVVQDGFTINDRLLRPSLVGVSKK